MNERSRFVRGLWPPCAERGDANSTEDARQGLATSAIENKLYVTLNGYDLFRVKVQPARRRKHRVLRGEVDILLDFREQLTDAEYFYSTDRLKYIGAGFNAISWHSFAVEKDGGISVPKVHFKQGTRRVCENNYGYVHAEDVIAYPVVSVIMRHWSQSLIPNVKAASVHRASLNFNAEPPFCVDLFVLPAGVTIHSFMSENDVSVFLPTVTNSIFMPGLQNVVERCHYHGNDFGQLKFYNINGWTCIARLSDPPDYTQRAHLPQTVVLSYDLRTAVSSLLDRAIVYPTEDPNVFHKTTFRRRLTGNPQYVELYRHSPRDRCL